MERHQITGHTELIGLMAYPIRHSQSPATHNAAYEALGVDIVNLCFEVDAPELEDAIKGLRALKLRGSNISMPNKTIVHKYLDEISPAAKLCGAVNTVVNKDGYLIGHITDGIGYMQSLADNDIDPIGKKVTIVGSGGAATAVQIQAALDGVAEMSIFARDDKFKANAEETVKKINENTSCKAVLYPLEDLDRLKAEMDSSYLFTNATGVGMKPLEGITYIPDKSYFHPDLIVTDVIYAPHMTKMLEMAKEAGCKIMNGQGMMLFQAIAAIELMLGQRVDSEYMKQKLGIKYEY
ncbi:MAG: shikimate dehydrogenase [Eubacteriales bacterium]|nr:shikimate dehydrogenase [Eubacteriales bacterium]